MVLGEADFKGFAECLGNAINELERGTDVGRFDPGDDRLGGPGSFGKFTLRIFATHTSFDNLFA